jgi:iron(II)-dependent oxidoreductase
MLLPQPFPNFAIPQAAHHARTACAADLAQLLQDSRARTLALAQAYVNTLGPELPVPYAAELNPPLWELGHIGWFQEAWIARNPQRFLGHRADPLCARSPSNLASADALYDSSAVPHATRWHLPLPDLQATLAYLSESLSATLACLACSAEDDASLYFYRLALFHEDMHAEAAVYMAQSMGLDVSAGLGFKPLQAMPKPVSPCTLDAGVWPLGLTAESTPGFAFDNELVAHAVEIPAFEIDNQVVSWRRYLGLLPAEQDGSSPQSVWPRYLRQRALPQGRLIEGRLTQGLFIWEQCHFGQWIALDLDAPACHLSYPEVQAWCQRAGRALPTEAQWEKAALTHPGFQWGHVWEWTASTFDAYPGFEPHPYRDYSAPWFGTRPVLRGASSATVSRMAHPRYRNFFTPERTDIYAGFRSCAAL